MIDSPCGGFVRPKIARTHKVAGSLKAELVADISIEASSVATGDCFNRVNYCHIHLVSSVSSISLRPQRPVRKHSRMVAPILNTYGD